MPTRNARNRPVRRLRRSYSAASGCRTIRAEPLEERTLLTATPFSAAQTISAVPLEPEAVYSADLDGDGDLDVLSASVADDTIAWYENLGGGVFGSQLVIASDADQAQDVFAADLDGDNDVDVLSVSFADNKIAWYENDGTPGDGGWTTHVITTGAMGASAVFADDVNADGDVDVMSASYNDGTIRWFQNDGTPGDGGWVENVLTSTLTFARDVEVADIDGDTLPDIVGIDLQKVIWFANQGGGSFSGEHAVNYQLFYGQSLATGDVDDDGDIDLAVASQGTDTIAWYENLGGGDFGPFTTTQQVITNTADGAAGVSLFDADNDGDLDVAASSEFDNTVAWYENLGGGTFGSQIVLSSTSGGVRGLHSADLNGDGDADLLAAVKGDDDVVWFESQLDPPPVAAIEPVSPDPSPVPVQTIDITFDLPVTGVDAGDFEYRRNGVLIDSSAAILSGSGKSYTVDVSAVPGSDEVAFYSLTLVAAGSGITASSGAGLAAGASDSWLQGPDVQILTDIFPGGGYIASPRDFTVIDGFVLFSATDPDNGRELWRTDGTSGGTELVKDIQPGSLNSAPTQTFDVGNSILFTADDGQSGRELWRTDGTEAGTFLLKDIQPGSTGSNPKYSTLSDGILYFVINQGGGLWRSDGTDAGTYELLGDASANDLAAADGHLYFRANTNELWKTDGTLAGTVLVKDFAPLGSGTPKEFTQVGSDVLFKVSTDSVGTELWKTDGTLAGTVLVKDINPGPASSGPSNLINFNETLFFNADDGTNGRELWKSDGTTAGTVLVKDINPGADSSDAVPFLTTDDLLFIFANDGVHDDELWKSDGTTAGTALVADVNPTGDGIGSTDAVSIDNVVYFGGDDGVIGTELWQTDGTAAGTGLLRESYPGHSGGNPQSLTDFNGALLLRAGFFDNDSDLAYGRFGDNTDPVADAGGPYLDLSAGFVALDATASFDPDVGDSLTYFWDINNDGRFVDAVGANPILTVSDLAALGIGPETSTSVRVRVSDAKGGGATSAPVTLTVDVTPVVTIDTLATNDASPQLTGTVDDPAATIEVTVDGNTYPATNNGNGTWTLADDTISPSLADGAYDVVVTATDATLHVGSDATNDELTIDTTAPVVTVDVLFATNPSPELTGTVDDVTAVIEVTVDGNSYPAVNEGDGTWTLPVGTIAPLVNGTYDVAVSATDTFGNVGNDATTDELTIAAAAVVTVDPLITRDSTPELTGTVDQLDAVVEVIVNGNTYAATNNLDGTWTLTDDTISPPLGDATYDVAVTATTGGGVGTDSTTDELIVDAAPPVVTVDSLFTSDDTPPLSGTVDDPDAVVIVETVDGVNYAIAAQNNGDGTWSLPDDLIGPLSDGVKEVVVSATDELETVFDTTTLELTIDTVLPVVTVDALATGDATPELTGTINRDDATIEVTVDGNSYAAINNCNGTWTLPDDTISPPLADGIYDVAVSATAPNGVAADATLDELFIDTTFPVVTVDVLGTGDTSPPLTGTVDDPTALVDVTVAGMTYVAFNNGDGTWLLPDDVLAPPLLPGTYDVQVTATDTVGNEAVDATVDELTILELITVTVDPLATSDATPELTGTVDDPTASVEVKVDGVIYSATNNGDGTWTLADDTIFPALVDGTFDIQVTATNALDHVGFDATVDELVVDAFPSVMLGRLLPGTSPVPVTSVSVEFTESVTGLDWTDFTLMRDGVPLDLSTAVVTGSGADFVLDLSSVVGIDLFGKFSLTLAAAGSGIIDSTSNAPAADANTAWRVADFSQPFVPRSVSTDPDEPEWVHSADVDGDGDLDVLSASVTDDTIGWYENMGGGMFGPRWVIASDADGAQSVYAADFDDDGDVDVLSASYYDNKIAWYENDGTPADGGWTTHVISTSAVGANMAIAADVDQDGNIDVLSASADDGTIRWFQNDGTPADGGWVETVLTSTLPLARGVEVADLDGDTLPDVVGIGDDKLVWFTNQGGGTFSGEQLIDTQLPFGQAVVAGDLDNDGDIDLVTASYGDDKIAWYENLGGGNFGVAGANQLILSTTADGAIGVALFDAELDGDLDVAAVSQFDNTVAWFENLGSGAFGSENVISDTSTGVRGVHTGDLDGDGDTDVLAAVRFADEVVWFENQTFAQSPYANSRFIATPFETLVDIDNDGDLDGVSDVPLAWYENDGHGSYGPQQIIDTPGIEGSGVGSVDMNGDGLADLLVLASGEFPIWYENLGGGSFGPSQEVPVSTGSSGRRFADLNGDGAADLMYYSLVYTNGLPTTKIAWRANDGNGNFGAATLLGTDSISGVAFYRYVATTVADFNQDGYVDIAASRIGEHAAFEPWNDIRVFWGVGGGSFVETQAATGKGAVSLRSADLNNDGFPDIVASSSTIFPPVSSFNLADQLT